MRYHGIETDSMLNGDGLRVVLWVSGCPHHCEGCHNPQTWNEDSGLPFTQKEVEDIYAELEKPHISGITISGGDPLYCSNRPYIHCLVSNIKHKYPSKSIWLYTGYEYDDIQCNKSMRMITDQCNVLVTGRFVQELTDVNYHWAGSTNQRVIDVQKSLQVQDIVLYQ